MILSQICETLTEMSRRSRLLPWVGAAALLTLAGCCGSGSTHKCDFTPPTTEQDASPPDGGVKCPDQPCKLPQACCVTKAPVNISCVNLQDFPANNCLKLNTNPPACLGPMDCLNGNVCCFQPSLTLFGCQPIDACPGDGNSTWIICTQDADCPATAPVCMQYGSNPETGAPVGYCWPAGSPQSSSGSSTGAP